MTSMTDERKAPAFQFYADDFLAGVMGMDDNEVGIYIKLLALQWTKGGIGPRERKAASHDKATVESVLELKFVAGPDGVLRNNRLEKIRNTQVARSKVGSKGGSKAQANRVAKPQAKSVAKQVANDQAKINTPSPSPSPSPSSTPVPVPNSEREKTPPSRHWNSLDFVSIWDAWKNKQAINNGVMMDGYTEQAQLYDLERFETDEAVAVVRYSLSRTNCRNLILSGEHRRKPKHSHDTELKPEDFETCNQ